MALLITSADDFKMRCRDCAQPMSVVLVAPRLHSDSFLVITKCCAVRAHDVGRPCVEASMELRGELCRCPYWHELDELTVAARHMDAMLSAVRAREALELAEKKAAALELVNKFAAP